MQRLKSDFEANGGCFKEYSLSDLFTKKTMRGYPKSKENLAPQKNGYYIYGQNIKRQYPQKVLLDACFLHEVEPEFPILAYTSSVGEIGMIDESFYRSGDNGAFQGLFPIRKIGRRPLLYILSVLQKQFASFGYTTCMAYVMELKISLPTTRDGEIAFDYMQKYIAQLEAERVAQLEAYLKAAGLENASLTEKEQKALTAFRSGKIEFSSFRIGDLFEKCDLKFKKKKFNKVTDVSKEKTDEFSLPLVNAKDGNNGIMYYGKEEDFDATEMSIDIVNDGAVSTGNVYPQPQKTGVLYNAYLIKYKRNVSEKLLMFFAQSIQKSIKLKFDYAKKASWERVKNELIQLPVLNGNIDESFIEAFISAQQKLSIKNVVAWKEKIIHETQNLINS